jgi:hypothetical protein
MPQARVITVRETIDLVAPWYSQDRLPAEPDTRYLTLQRRPKLDELGQPTEDDEWVETFETARYVEHITLYRRLSHGDSKWIGRQGNMFKGFDPNSGTPKIDEAQMQRLRTLGYLRRVVELTNAQGEAQPHATEADFDTFDEPELQYLDAAIKVLDDPAAPILQIDRDKAQAAADHVAQLEAAGVPVKDESQVNVEAYATQLAHDATFPADQRDLPGESQ